MGTDWKETEKKEAAGDKPKEEAKVEKDAEKKEDKKDRRLCSMCAVDGRRTRVPTESDLCRHMPPRVVVVLLTAGLRGAVYQSSGGRRTH